MTRLTLDLESPIEFVELSHPMVRGMPNHASHPAYDLVPYFRPGDFVLDGGYGGANELLLMSGHSGTHLDAIGHVTRDGVGYGGVGVGQLGSGVDGLACNGIDAAQPIVRRGVLLDFVKLRGAPIGPERAITAHDVERLLDRDGLTISPGDCVLVRTGWSRHWHEPGRYMGEAVGSPGIDVSAADLLCDRGALLIGGETAVVEHQAPGSHELPVHMRVLADRGVHLLENLDLEGLARREDRMFVFLCLPLRLQGATGSPVRAVAAFQ